MKPMQVMIVDDHQLVRHAFKKLLADHKDVHVVAEASSGEEAIAVASAHQLDMVLMDIHMPGMDGIQAMRQLLSQHPHLKIMVITAYHQHPYPEWALTSGAAAYLTKACHHDIFLQALKAVLSGQRYISPVIAQELAFITRLEKSPFDGLSNRQLQVMQRLVLGKNMQNIANELSLSAKVINSYRSQVFIKLKVDNDVGLVLLAKRFGVI